MLVYFRNSNHYQNVRALVYSGDLEAKETIGDGGGRQYANSQFLQFSSSLLSTFKIATRQKVGGSTVTGKT